MKNRLTEVLTFRKKTGTKELLKKLNISITEVCSPAVEKAIKRKLKDLK